MRMGLIPTCLDNLPANVRQPEPPLIDESLVLQRGAQDTTPIIPASRNDLQTAASALGIQGQGFPLSIRPPSSSFKNVKPGTLQNVSGDGDCLFHCFS